MVDDRLFYVGSNNLYPSNLQEFGYVIDNKELTQEFLNQYQNKLWYYSKATCYFRQSRKKLLFFAFALT
ncbi:hypothetical protein [Coxiella-like endosymbiont]|uniref:hypothetical protein n=1 Tax=Coxiella-like endosymbiont TaxID=1592897 RepID=UPI0034E1E7C9